LPRGRGTAPWVPESELAELLGFAVEGYENLDFAVSKIKKHPEKASGRLCAVPPEFVQ